MGVKFAFGKKLVDSREVEQASALGTMNRFLEEADRGGGRTLSFSTAVLSTSDVAAPTPDFAPIGLGKPFSAEIIGFYTGDAPSRGIFGILGRSDLLVASAARNAIVHDAAPRAINQMRKTIDDRAYLTPAAVNAGSPVIFYSPAMTASTTLISVELVTDSFDKSLVNSVSQLLKGAGGLPVFAPASSYLLAGAMVVDILGELGEVFLETGPFLRDDLSIRFDTPQMVVAKARNAVFHNDTHRAELEGYELTDVDGELKLVKGGEVYLGHAPYVVVSFDGRTRGELADFAPRHVTAAMLERFYGPTNRVGTVVTELEKALDLYNDFTFHQKAKDLKERIDDLPEGSKERADAEKLLEAYDKNIRNKLLKTRT